MTIDEMRAEQIKNFLSEEELTTYTLSENFDNTIKSVEFKTDSMDEIFSKTMDFLKYTGFSDEHLVDCFNDYMKGDI